MPKHRVLEDRPLTDVEKQRRYREKKRNEGKHDIRLWLKYGLLLERKNDLNTFPAMDIDTLKTELDELYSKANLSQKQLVYAELFEYAKLLKKNMDKFETVFSDHYPELNIDQPGSNIDLFDNADVS